MKALPVLFVSLIAANFASAQSPNSKKLIGDSRRFVQVKPPPGLFVPRNLASLDSTQMIAASQSRVQYGEARTPMFDDDALVQARFSLLGGRSYGPPGDSSTPAGQWLGGLTAEAQIAHYFGVAADGAYAATASRSETSADGGTVTHSSNYYSAQTTVQGQLPFRTGFVGWIPKLGVGYGTLVSSAQDVASDATNATTSSTLHLSAPILSLGVEVDFYGKLSVGVDYTHSLLAKATDQVGSQASVDLANGSFDRARLTVFYRLIPHLAVGGQYAHRSWQVPGISLTDNQQDQVLGLVQFEL